MIPYRYKPVPLEQITEQQARRLVLTWLGKLALALLVVLAVMVASWIYTQRSLGL